MLLEGNSLTHLPCELGNLYRLLKIYRLSFNQMSGSTAPPEGNDEVGCSRAQKASHQQVDFA